MDAKARRCAKTGLKLAVTALLLFLLYRKVDGKAFAELFARMDWRWPPLFFAIAFANMGLSSVRWRLFLRADGLDVSVGKLFAIQWQLLPAVERRRGPLPHRGHRREER